MGPTRPFSRDISPHRLKAGSEGRAYQPSPYSPCDADFPYVGYRALGVLGLVIAGLFAAVMSTLSASMNSSATAFLTDIYPKLKHPSQASSPAPEDGKRMLRLARPVTLVLEVLGGLGGLFLLRMTTKRANSSGAACG